MIEIEALQKSFGRVQALSDVTFKAADGQITGLIGPNGAGKTTTFRLIYGALRPTAGRIRIDACDVARDRLAALGRLGALPDVRGLYPRLTPREHLRYFGTLHGLNGKTLERRIARLLEQLDLTSIADRRTEGMSRGQQLRVALGRALIHRPPNIILDEPTNGLDIVGSRSVRRMIAGLRDAGHCIVVSSHNMSEIGMLCDHIAIIHRGRIVLEGAPDSLQRSTGFDDLEDVFMHAIDPAGAGDSNPAAGTETPDRGRRGSTPDSEDAPAA